MRLPPRSSRTGRPAQPRRFARRWLRAPQGQLRANRRGSAGDRTAAFQIDPEKVLHCCMEPVFRPRVNQFTRCCDVPWVKLSGTA